MPTGIIFDLDGTLADTAPDLLAALNHSVRDHGFPEFSLDEVGHLVGQGSLAMIRRGFALHQTPLPDELLKQLHREFLEYYSANIAVHSKLFPGVMDLIERLAEDDHRICICTNKYENMARQFLTETGIIDRFSSITGGDTFDFRKPDGRHLHKTLELAGATNGIMIGDTITDADAARNAELPLIMVDFGYAGEPVSNYNPDSVISSFKEGYEVIRQIIER